MPELLRGSPFNSAEELRGNAKRCLPVIPAEAEVGGFLSSRPAGAV